MDSLSFYLASFSFSALSLALNYLYSFFVLLMISSDLVIPYSAALAGFLISWITMFKKILLQLSWFYKFLSVYSMLVFAALSSRIY